MEITGIRVSFRRNKQPASYESAEPFVEISGGLDSGDDPEQAIRTMLYVAARGVYATLGYESPPSAVVKALTAGETASPADEVTVEKKGRAISDSPEDRQPPEEGEQEKKSSGGQKRSSGGQKKSSGGQRKKTSGGQKKDAEEAPAETSADAPVEESSTEQTKGSEEITDKDLQNKCSEAVKHVDATAIRKMMSGFGNAGRLRDIPQNLRADFMAAVDAEIERAKTEKADESSE